MTLLACWHCIASWRPCPCRARAAPCPAWTAKALAAGLLARGIGDFNYLGLFKRLRGSRFATLDTYLYSPLCLLLAAGVAAQAYRT
jgi:hypothetical protein